MKNTKTTKQTVLVHRQSPIKSAFHRSRRKVRFLRDRDIKIRMKRIDRDFAHAFKILRNHTDTVTVFGSTRFKEGHPYYEQARALAHRISRELNLTIATGGGPGIMEAANRGAREACTSPEGIHSTKTAAMLCGDSLAMTIELPMEQISNPYANYTADFYYFFSRKVALAYSARAYICFPGGFGTLDEFFEVLTLKQTGKIPDIPIILCGVEYWKPLLEFIETTVYERVGGINKSDMTLYTLTDDFDEILQIVAKAKPASFRPPIRKKLIRRRKKVTRRAR